MHPAGTSSRTQSTECTRSRSRGFLNIRQRRVSGYLALRTNQSTFLCTRLTKQVARSITQENFYTVACREHALIFERI